MDARSSIYHLDQLKGPPFASPLLETHALDLVTAYQRCSAMTADVHVRIDVSSLLVVGAAAAAAYGAVRYLQLCPWPSAAKDSSGKPRDGKEPAAALKAQLLQLHYPLSPVPAPEADADVPMVLQAIFSCLCCASV